MAASRPEAAAAPIPPTPPAAQPGEPGRGSTFPLFADLPAELRLKIWHFSFEPRVVALYTRKLHYADDAQSRGIPVWQSRNANPAQLSASVEARQAALEHYTVSLALAPERAAERAGESPPDPDRRLYLSPRDDTAVVLGEFHVERVQKLLRHVRQHDPRGRGLRRLGVGAGCFAHQGGGWLLRVYAKNVFRDLDELLLFMYNGRAPPDSWPTGGECELLACHAADYYRRFVLGRGAELRNGDEWLRVGRANAELRVVDLVFRSERGSDIGREVDPVEAGRLMAMFPDMETDMLNSLLADADL